jgi:hypothetical protein
MTKITPSMHTIMTGKHFYHDRDKEINYGLRGLDDKNGSAGGLGFIIFLRG